MGREKIKRIYKKVWCPRCTSELKYTFTNVKKYLIEDDLVRCKNCKFIFSKEESEKIEKVLGEKKFFKEL